MSVDRFGARGRAICIPVLVSCAYFAAAEALRAQGQVVLDNFTIGNTADDVILTLDPSSTFNITEDLGQRSGNNLFHSFNSFDIENGETALFTGDPSINSIISRVTGGSASLIDGVLRSEVIGAGFWFVNSTGLVLGPNAQIDVGGAFNAGSADHITFVDGLEFSTFDQSVELSVASPSAFGFLENGGGAGIMTLDSIELGAAPSPGVESYNGLLFGGREVTVNDSMVRTLGEGTAQGDIEISGGRITIDSSRLTTSTDNATPAGAITLNGSEIALVGQTELSTETTGPGSAGAISIVATGRVTAVSEIVVNRFSGEESEQGPFISAGSYDRDAGAAGNVTIRGGDIDLAKSLIASVVQTDQTGLEASRILLDAAGGSLVLADVLFGTTTVGVADGGSVVLMADIVDMSDVTVESITEDQQAGLGAGAAGSVTISGTTSVTMRSTDDQDWSIRTASQLLESGQPGDVTIQGGTIDLSGGAIRSFTDSVVDGHVPSLVLIDAGRNSLRLSNMVVETSTRGENDAGFITLTGGNVILESDTSVVSDSTTITYPRSDICGGTVCTELIGAAGEISVRGDAVSLVNSTIAATTESPVADNIEAAIDIVASAGELSLTGSHITSATTGRSAAGIINLDGTTLRVEDTIISSTSGEADSGSAGIIELNGIDSVNVSRSTLATETMSDIRGNEAGWIKIETTAEMTLQDSFLTATTLGESNAGFIDLDGTSIRLIGSTVETTSATNDSGAAGVIDIDATSLVELTQSSINTNTHSNVPTTEIDTETGEEVEVVGWININLPLGSLVMKASDLTATTFGQAGAGFVDLNVGTLDLLEASVISTEAKEPEVGDVVGDAGVITVRVAGDATIAGSVDNFSGITTRAAESDSGDVTVEVGGRLDLEAGLIEASAGFVGQGGSVFVTAGDVIMQESGMLARAEDGDGGLIFLTITGSSELFVLGSESLINADSDSGNTGEIDINVLDVDLDSGLQQQDANIVVAPELAADACSPSASGEMSTFVQADEGGTPVAPDRYLTANVQTMASSAAAGPPATDEDHSEVLLAAMRSNSSEACR